MRTATRDDLEAFAEQHPDRRFELIHGEIVEKMPTQLHAYIVAMLAGFLFVFLQEHPIGYVLVKARYGLPDDTANDRIPDLSFASKDKGPLLTVSPAPYMPDLAVEVQSPGQSDRFMTDRAAYYLANGSRAVWLIYPDRRLVEVLTSETRHLLTDESTLDGGDVLPGFSVDVGRLFPSS